MKIQNDELAITNELLAPHCILKTLLKKHADNHGYNIAAMDSSELDIICAETAQELKAPYDTVMYQIEKYLLTTMSTQPTINLITPISSLDNLRFAEVADSLDEIYRIQYGDIQELLEFVNNNATDIYETCYTYVLVRAYQNGAIIPNADADIYFFKYDTQTKKYVQIFADTSHKAFNNLKDFINNQN